MRRKLANYLYFIAGSLFVITSALNFADGKMSMGTVYLCLAITFISLGFAIYRNDK